ncbi:MAG TPA: hypothetical protein VMW15_06095 [Terracidiphilus sp.]|nr:hypothetical protein [Terracidiphilus sp.]
MLSSPYYWWFKFLQLNEDYRRTCEAQGSGECAALYSDFGDVRAIDFKSWWREHAHLFAEKREGYTMRIAGSAADLAPFESADAVNLVVPLTWTRRGLKRRFDELIVKRVERAKRGVSVEASNAKYTLSGRWNSAAMENAYQVYRLRNQMKNAKRRPLADVAIEAGLRVARGLELGKKGARTVEGRYEATIIASRHYKRAEKFIKNAASQSFPYPKPSF